jgi:hypothetical protein
MIRTMKRTPRHRWLALRWVATLLLFALAPSAAAAQSVRSAGVAPLAGRWIGSSRGGAAVSFDVARLRRREVLTNYVVYCQSGLIPQFAVDGWDRSKPHVPHVSYPISRSGKLGRGNGTFRSVSGRLGRASGTVRSRYQVGPCPGASFTRIHVHPSSASSHVRARDGRWLLVGSSSATLPTVVAFWVLGGGTVIDNDIANGIAPFVYGVACGTLSGCSPCGTGLLAHLVIGPRGQLDFADNEDLLVLGQLNTSTLATGVYAVHINTPYLHCNSLDSPWAAHYVSGG